MVLSTANPATLGQFELTMADGRKIWMTKLEQWLTYGGLLCGYPHREMNEYHLTRLKETALELSDEGSRPTLLDPEITAYDYPPPGRRRIFKCEALPPVSSVAIFTSVPTKRDEGCNSSATIAWFQHDWGKPRSEICQEIVSLDWEQIAKDWMW